MRGIGISVGILLGSTYLSRPFNVATALFGAGEPGGWYDPSDLSTMFQDSAGTTPVTATGQTVGLVLDKSKGLVLGPELVTNGDFSQGSTGWTLGSGWSVSGGELIAATTGYSEAYTSVSVTAGRSYQVTFDVSGYSSGIPSVAVAGGAAATLSTGNGQKTCVVVAGVSAARVTIIIGAASLKIDNISVKELAGNHLTQSSLSNRPIYGIEPFGGRRNLLTYTEQFDNAAWTKASTTVTANSAVAPDGTTTADLLYPTSSGTNRWAIAFTTLNAGATYTGTIYVKAAGKSWVGFGPVRANSIADYVFFNVSNGTTGTVGASAISSSITDAGNGWYRLSVTMAESGTDAFYIAVCDANGSNAVTASGTDGILIWGAQLETGSTATAYQRVTDQWNVTQAGVPSVSYVQFDGSDDFYISPAITPGIDKAQVFAGVRKLSDAAPGSIVGLSVFAPGNTGAFELLGPSNTATPDYRWTTRGTIASTIAPSGFAAPVTNVMTGIGDIAADTTILRANGVQAATSTDDQGTGNYLAYPLYIGRRGNNTTAFNGRIYQMIVRFGANLPLATIQQAEEWVNSKTGAY